jgi:hypothetical protein
LVNIAAALIKTCEMAILLLDHGMLLQSSTWRPLGVKDLIQLLQSTATSFNAKDKPAEGVYKIEPNKDEIVAPIDGIKSNSSNIGIVEVCGV